MATTQSLLTKIETAIENLLGADAVSEYRIGNQTFRANDLDRLFDIRDRLKRQLARENSSPVRVGRLGRPSAVDRET